MVIFGYEIRRRPEPESIKSFVPETKDDGAVIVAQGGAYGTYIDLDGTVRTEAELVTKYREMALQPEIDRAVNEIVNDAIVNEDGKESVEILLDELPVQDDKIKLIIEQEFKEILKILNFRKAGYDIFKRWYIDGRNYWHVVIDEKRPLEGIKELRYIDPRKIRKIREVERKPDRKTQAIIQTTKKEYFMYADRGFHNGAKTTSNLATNGIKIAADSILHVTSGLTDQNNTMGLSYLHSAIKIMNQLRSLEDATLIYHLSRAPERLIFNIEVGQLPKMKAEQYVKEMMNNYKNKLAYDATTGEVKDNRKFMTMLENFWFPTREGKGTKVEVLSGGTALPDLLQSVEYFQDRLYRSLQVPVTRLKNDESGNQLGRATEINRDEINFAKFIDRIRNKFSELFLQALEKQLILKKITTPEDWDYLKEYIKFRFLRDTFAAELKDIEVMNERMNLLMQVKQLAAGSYYSHDWIRQNILKQSEEEIEEENQKIAMEFGMPQYHPELVQASMQNDMDIEKQKQLQKEEVEPEPIHLVAEQTNELDDKLKITLIELLENEKESDGK